MGTYHSTNLRYVVGKIEGTPGTAETPAAADHDVRVYAPEMSVTIEQDDEAAKDANGHHGEIESIPGMSYGTISFGVKMQYGGAVDTEPNWFKFSKACGGVTKAYAATGTALVPRQSGDVAPITLWVFDKERGGAAPVSTIYKFRGCMGNVVYSAEGLGKPWMANYTFTGALDDIIDGSALAMTAADLALPDTFLSSTFTWATNPYLISTFALDVGNEIVQTLDQSKTNGILYYSIGTRKPRFMWNPLSQKQATDDVLADILAANAGPVSLTSTNFTILGVDAQLMSAAMASREGYVSHDRVCKLLQNWTGAALIDAVLTNEDTWELLQKARA